MRLWKPLLVILPAGLVLGMVGARLVDSGTTRDPARDARERVLAAEAAALPSVFPEAAMTNRGLDLRDADPRPDLDWDSEYRPGDHREDRAGAYDYDGDYFGDGEPAFARSEDPSGAPLPIGRRGEAMQAALAAERAARDAERAGAMAPPPAKPLAPPLPPAVDRAPLPEPTAVPEPRTASGNLPAIW